MPPPLLFVVIFHSGANMRRGFYSGKLFLAIPENPFMNIQHKESGRHSMFYVEKDGDVVAEIVYTKRGEDTLVIEHTEVDEKLQGQHVGFELVKKTVEYARSHGLKISPACPFAKAVFDKRADFQDVRA